jgi:hypothetical protein
MTSVRPNLVDAESPELKHLLTEYGDIFAVNNDDYRQTNRMYHRMDMGEAPPPRRLPLAKQADVGENA